MAKKANGKARKKPNWKHETWIIEPPAEVITPAVARRWLRHNYSGLAQLGALGHCHPYVVRGLGSSERNQRASWGMISIDTDVRTITEICGKVLWSGRSIRMDLNSGMQYGSRDLARRLREVARWEAKHPHKGTRGILQRSIACHEAWKVRLGAAHA